MNSDATSNFTVEQIAEYNALAGRIMAAPQLNGSPKLRELFTYIMDCSLKDQPAAATEQQIGIHVFHRRPGYNSGDDSIVRSQMRLLRMKVANYFNTEGAHEPVLIAIPKGHYVPVFLPADAPAAETEPGMGGATPPPGVQTTDDPNPTRGVQRSGRWLAIAAVVLVMVGALAGYGAKAWVAQAYRAPGDVFWAPFVTSNGSLVIYSNPVFAGDIVNGFHLQGERLAMDTPGALVDDTYTGTGEASAIMTITRLFDAHEAGFILKRSRLVTWDEARLHNLIFVGASSQNGALGDLKTLNQFQIALGPDQRGYIRNLHPASGESANFPAISTESETAIIALMPGLSQATSIAIFSGLSTLGTQAAVEFMSHPENVAAIASKIGTSAGMLLPFEAVLTVTIRKGVPIGASLLAVHPHGAA